MKTSSFPRAKCAAAALLLLLSTSASAQSSVGTGASFESYSFSKPEAVGIESITLLTAPFGARVALFRNLSIEARSAFASGTLVRVDGTESTLSGLTDTDVSALFTIARNRVLLTATYTLPTGQATHTVEESEVAGAIAADLLPFRISNWGSGGGLTLDAAFATTMGETGIGFNVGYGMTREFEPLAEDERAYLPGNPLHARVAIDRTVGSAGKFSLLLSMQRFGDDELGGQNLYRSGDRYQGMVSYAFSAGARASGVVYSGWLRRQRGTFIDSSLFGSGAETPAQDLILMGGGVRLPVGSLVLLPSVDTRVFRSADGEGQGYALGAGVGSELRAGRLTILPAVRARFGNVIAREDVESSFTGIEASAAIRFGNPVR